MRQDLFRTKSLDAILADADEPEHQMKRALGPIELIAMGIGAIVGAGIFAVIGSAAAGGAHHDGAGPALVISILITAIVTISVLTVALTCSDGVRRSEDGEDLKAVFTTEPSQPPA